MVFPIHIPLVFFWRLTSLLVNILVQLCLLFTLTFSFCYRMGWCHRLMWSFLEKLACQAMNGAHVTIGSFSADFLRGILVLNNVIVHSPQRQKYEWESPVLMRLGKVHVEFNPVWILFAKYVLRDPNPPLEILLLVMSDVQCFLERKDHVFNVYLLDPFFVPPPDTNEIVNDARGPQLENQESNGEHETLVLMENREPNLTMSSSVDDDNGEASNEDHEQAEVVVGEMFKAVQSLGRAVQEGQLPQVLQEQRQRITKGLKDFHVNKQPMTDGLTLMQQISKMVVEKSQHAVTQSSLILQPKRQAPPAVQDEVYARFGRVIIDDLRIFTRTTIVEEVKQPSTDADQAEEEKTEKDLALSSSSLATLNEGEEQLGGVEVARKRKSATQQQIKQECGNQLTSPQHQPVSLASPSWTSSIGGERDVIIDESEQTPRRAALANNPLNQPQENATGATSLAKKPAVATVTKSYWNKPITVTRVAVRASEFGAPLNAKEEDTGFPILYQTLDKSVDAIIKRVVGDMAKSNTGRLVRTAMGEVLDFYMEKEYQNENE